MVISMGSGATLYSTREAAAQLGVSTRRVRELAARGVLDSVGDGFRLYVTGDSIRRFQTGGRRAGRPFSPRVSFAALYMICGEEAVWLSASERSRLKRRLVSFDVPRLLESCRGRAHVREFWCRENRLGLVLRTIRATAATGDFADGFGLTGGGTVEGYIPDEVLRGLIGQARLRSDFRPVNVRLRVASFMPPGEGDMPLGVCAADLAGSSDVRERAAGELEVGRMLERFKRDSGGEE